MHSHPWRTDLSDRCGESDCCAKPAHTGSSPRFRRALWIALIVNAGMFCVEFAAAWQAQSVSLLADAVDFLGDAANYGISLWALAMGALWRSRTALLKGLTMGGYGIFVLVQAVLTAMQGGVPDAKVMGVVGLLALVANLGVATLLYAWREGDANMRSVWLCSRNDAIGNVAVLLAAAGVFGLGAAWPDLLVAVLMGVLGLTSAYTVISQALGELKTGRNRWFSRIE